MAERFEIQFPAGQQAAILVRQDGVAGDTTKQQALADLIAVAKHYGLTAIDRTRYEGDRVVWSLATEANQRCNYSQHLDDCPACGFRAEEGRTR